MLARDQVRHSIVQVPATEDTHTGKQSARRLPEHVLLPRAVQRVFLGILVAGQSAVVAN